MNESWRHVFNRVRFAPPSRFADVLLFRPRFVWGAVLAPAFVVAESVAISVNKGLSLAGSLQVAGFLIGLSGLLLVAAGLSRTRTLFGRPTLLSKLAGWLKDVLALVIRPKVIPLSASAAVSLSAIGAFGGRAEAQADNTLEGRVAALERRAVAVEKQITEVRGEARQMVDEVRSEVRADADSIRASVTTLGKRLEDFSVGGLDLEGMGLVWLIVGSALSTFYEPWATLSIWRAFMA